MVRKKVDSRIRTLIENGVVLRHRTMFVIVGDRGRDQVVNLHYILSKARVRARPSVLWCYKKDLGFTSSREKRAKKLKKDIARGIRQADEENPFELFLGATDIKYTYYKETDRVLGQTFGMCVLQDFQSITPNILARTIETVEGGGIVVLLIKTLDSLKQLYSMAMDIHSRYRTEAHTDVVGRFNERFMMSLAHCQTCLVVDDELNILNISSHARNITKVSFDGKPVTKKSNDDDDDDSDDDSEQKDDLPVIFENDHALSPSEVELKELKHSLRDTQPVGCLLELARTLDQGKAILTFAEAITEKSLKSTVALMAARGRGKSAALGISLACAVAYGYSNIFVTAPTPENLKTLFEMVVVGFGALGYKEHMDYEVVESTNPKLNHAVVRINVFKSHRQTIQYILPQDSHKLSQCELLVIDEAAAIPLPLVQRLFGPYLVFLASTVNGYEGTGRSLSLKLIKTIRDHSSQAHLSALSSQNSASLANVSSVAASAMNDPTAKTTVATSSAIVSASLRGRTLREITLIEPIRYAANDPIEAWLNDLLCLNCATQVPKLLRAAGGSGVPHPSQCELFYVDRDTLFSHHKMSEAFLQRMIALYVSSHYKNSPNDLQLMSDAPSQHLFVLLGPVTGKQTGVPDILCVIQVALEGEISSSAYIRQTAQGISPSGDLIPWCVSQQFQNSEFASLSGARIVRIAVHPELHKMGYGSRAMELLTAYYEEKLTSLAEDDDEEEGEDAESAAKKAIARLQAERKAEASGSASSTSTLLTEIIAPRKNLPPLLTPLSDRKPEALHWLGVSYGLTPELYSFWSKHSFVPLYLRQSVNDVTGEHTCVMVRAQKSARATAIARSKGIAHGGMAGDEGALWLKSFHEDFTKRMTSLLGFDFRNLPASLVLSVMGGPSKQSGGGASLALMDNSSTSSSAPLGAGGDNDDMDDEKESNSSSSSSSRKVSASSSSLLTAAEMAVYFTEYDLKRLESYSRNLVDYHMILDLLPALARVYFLKRTDVALNFHQAVQLLAVGLQFKSINDVEIELGVGATQLLALFNKTIRKLSAFLRQVEERAMQAEIVAASMGGNSSSSSSSSKAVSSPTDLAGALAFPSAPKLGKAPVGNLEAELKSSGKESLKDLKAKQDKILSGLRLEQFAIAGTDADWEASTKNFNPNSSGSGRLSVASSAEKTEMRTKMRMAGTPQDKKNKSLADKSAKKEDHRKRKTREHDDD